MGLGDPFGTTYKGAYEGLGSTGDDISSLAEDYARRKERKQEKSEDIAREDELIELGYQRGLEKEERNRRDLARNSAQEAASEAFMEWLETHEGDVKGAEKIAEQVFNMTAANMGFPDMTYVSTLSGEEEIDKDEDVGPSLIDRFLPVPPEYKPGGAKESASPGEQTAARIKESPVIPKLLELPRQVEDIQTQAYNFFPDFLRGITGMPAQGVTPEQTAKKRQQEAYMAEGVKQLFNVPGAIDFYQKLLGRQPFKKAKKQ